MGWWYDIMGWWYDIMGWWCDIMGWWCDIMGWWYDITYKYLAGLWMITGVAARIRSDEALVAWRPSLRTTLCPSEVGRASWSAVRPVVGTEATWCFFLLTLLLGDKDSDTLALSLARNALHSMGLLWHGGMHTGLRDTRMWYWEIRGCGIERYEDVLLRDTRMCYWEIRGCVIEKYTMY